VADKWVWSHLALSGVPGDRGGKPALSVFSAPKNYGVLNITRSSSEVVLQTMKHTMIYLDSCPSLEVIALHLVV
jgi:hypothetical protein